MTRENWIVAGLGALGVLVSWTYFVASTSTHGFVDSWIAAFTGHPFSAGLHWDLVFSLLIVCALAVFDRRRLGGRFVVATLVMGCILGVCAALAVYWIGLQRARQRARTRSDEVIA